MSWEALGTEGLERSSLKEGPGLTSLACIVSSEAIE